MAQALHTMSLLQDLSDEEELVQDSDSDESDDDTDGNTAHQTVVF